MNKRIFAIIAGCFLTISLHSQTSLNALYNDFSHEANVEKVNLNKFVMTLLYPFTRQYNGSRISSIHVLTLDDCSSQVKQHFNESALKFREKDYELFVNSNEDDETVRVFLKFHKNAIREMVVITMGNNPSLVHLKGKIKPEDIENLSNEKR